ncbi:hypothetical protein KTT_35870 [Tengunoibacter tsumagoiensis]|uniref:Uncharacterized protein n=2 Tax=Tengunoibacter tsumagoiensis TaxID=2014871 RepID=A0A402A3I9_9CHLR|nr:hypothetical protein KTT_35870 [Tengunoibacter tsumagoiensis]
MTTQKNKNVTMKARQNENLKVQRVPQISRNANNAVMLQAPRVTRVRRFRRGMMIWVEETEA